MFFLYGRRVQPTAEQDSFSHLGFGPTLGQAPFYLIGGDPRLPDKTRFNPARADAMAKDAFLWLLRARNGKGSSVSWDILEPFVNKWNRALPDEKPKILKELEAIAEAYRH